MVNAAESIRFHLTVEDNPQPASDRLAGDELAEKVDRAKDGDVGAFEWLVSHFEGRVFHFLMRLAGNRHDAEDLTQETFLRAWKNLHRFRSECAFATWIFTIARRAAANHHRSRKSQADRMDRLAVQQELDEPAASPASSLMEKDRGSRIWDLARRLKPAQYEAICLVYQEGFSMEETARIMNTNSIRVRVLLHRARKRLKTILSQTPIEGEQP